MKFPRSFSPSLRVALLATAVVAMSGCSTIGGWFSSKDSSKKAAKPTELAAITPTMNVAELWNAKVGGGEGHLGLRQGPVVDSGRVYAAAVKGGVYALDLQTGKAVWHHETKVQVSGGPGVGEGLVVVGGLEGEVIALDAATGAEKWTAKVGNEVIAAPTVGQGRVFVRSVDGRVTAFDSATGERRWFWNHDLPTLTARGNDGVTLGPGVLFVGNDDGTVTMLAVNDGHPLWDLPIAQPEGRNELERMADVDGTPVLEGGTLFATSMKKTTMAIDAPNGRPMWSAEHGGPGRPAVGSDRVVVTEADGGVFALDKSSGGALWQQAGLLRRDVTAPAVVGDVAVVGDLDGYVHWLRLSDGAFAARTRAGGDAILAAPVVSDGIVLVQNIDGRLTAFRAQ
ncbi:outer membrane protein assembly factor BamB [Lysobacter sp. TY2-98]|uniref:outer membrane protein assembly factor BamB n=1 Tax=Lysobacter sp. TY2-98 TaxID=2290922 RepID=UPI000E1FEC82|nr:outer membrane protein assembly factor BamB [Lysobacter sp. TY2-98]AXK71726.1 outer membrane protein assembly factor BamB [Lysobacter sp. TY2-98]